MGLFTLLNLEDTLVIDWDMCPEYTFGTFESWGGRERIRSKKERIYYFFIDAWEEVPRLCLMERANMINYDSRKWLLKCMNRV